MVNNVWLFFIKLNVSYEKRENQISQALPVFVSCPISGDVHSEVSLLTVACDSSSASHTLGGQNCCPEGDHVAKSPKELTL